MLIALWAHMLQMVTLKDCKMKNADSFIFQWKSLWWRSIYGFGEDLVCKMFFLQPLWQETRPEVSFSNNQTSKNTLCPGLNFTSSTWNPHASGKYRQHSQKYFQKFSCYERFPPELKKRISDNLKEREAETLKRRSASPAAPTTAGSGRNKSVSWSV